MKRPISTPLKRTALALFASTLLMSSLGAHAEEREDLEKLRATVLSLIETLVKSGVIPRTQADAMMREAEVKANARLAALPPPEVGADGKKVVRIPYVPEAVKTQMRDQIKSEVLAETRGQTGATLVEPDSITRFKVDGDFRLRSEATVMGSGNTPSSTFSTYASSASGRLLTRGPDLIPTNLGNITLGNGSQAPYVFDPTQDTNRERIRARVGVTAMLSPEVKVGLGIASGNTSVPVSTNQTIGQGSATSPGYFNKFAATWDRANIRYEPKPWLSFVGGRFENPFVKTDLVWADDLNFDGVAMRFSPKLGDTSAFVTAGWFPLTTFSPNQQSNRSFTGLQAGADWNLGQKNNLLRVALGYYDYKGIEGVGETTTSGAQAPSNYVSRSEYNPAYAQRGNTLFRLNSPYLTTSAVNWGLASSFRELDLVGSLDLNLFDPNHVILTADLVENMGFDTGAIGSRTGSQLVDGKSIGFLGRILVGKPVIKNLGDWNMSAEYRYLGSDAVLDAFTNGDFGLGGTNNKGTVLFGNYGVAKNTWVSLKWMSSDLIDSMVPTTSMTNTQTKFSVDYFFFDINARF